MLSHKQREKDLGEDRIRRTARAIFKPPWIFNEPSLWPRVRNSMGMVPARRPDMSATARLIPAVVRPAWRWTVAGICASLIALGFGLFALRPRPAGHRAGLISAAPASGPGPRIEILSSRWGGRLATAFLYQTQGASYVWIVPPGGPGRQK
jgi:hypothetical protein